MLNENKKIVGYNTQTGEPIYENSHLINDYQVNVMNNQFVNNNYKKNNVSKKIIIFLLMGIVISLILLAIVLFKTDNKSYSRTFIIYMVGADLESNNGLATVDLEEINYNDISRKNNKVVLIAGGTSKWNNNYIDVSSTSIYELTNNGFIKVKEQDIQNMGSEDVFSDFLNYVYNNYKTDKYDLIFWNHGAAILGSEFDEISDDNLSLEEMRNGLRKSPFNSNNKLENVIFRTCLNGSLEVADVFDEYADYFVASEEVTNGYKLKGIFDFLNNIESTDNSIDVSKKFINSYKNMISSLNQTLYYLGEDETYIYSTYSIVDLSKVKDLENSLNDFFTSIDLTNNYNEVARVRSNLYQYAYDEKTFDMVDLYNLVYNLKDISPSKANKLLKDIEKTVIYNWATNDKSRGISIYFPYNGSKDYQKSFLSLYSNFNSLNGYNKFINDFNSYQNLDYTKYSYLDNKINVSSDNKEADFELELTDEQLKSFAKASYIVFRDESNGYYYPVYRGNNVKLNGNKILANIKDRQLKAISTKDGLENIVTLIEEDNNDEYIKYQALVTLEDFKSSNMQEWKYDAAKMSLVYNKKTGDTKIGSIILNNGNDMPGVVAVNLNDYTNIVFASSSYKILDDYGNYTMDWISDGTIKGMEEKVDNIEFKLQNYDEGRDYYCVFYIYDVNNNISFSKLVKIK